LKDKGKEPISTIGIAMTRPLRMLRTTTGFPTALSAENLGTASTPFRNVFSCLQSVEKSKSRHGIATTRVISGRSSIGCKRGTQNLAPPTNPHPPENNRDHGSPIFILRFCLVKSLPRTRTRSSGIVPPEKLGQPEVQDRDAPKS
jgi:hypothetical protein